MKPKLLATSIVSIAALPISAHAALFATAGHLDAPAFGYVSEADALLSGDPQGFEPHIHNEGGSDGVVINGVVQTDESEYEPDEVVIVLKSTVTTNLGGTDYYWLPELAGDASSNGVPFLGVGLEELDPLDWDGGTGTVTISLESITGPGEFRLWQVDEELNVTNFINTDGGPTSFTLIAGSHTHFNWGFTEEGIYELEFGISGTHVDDGFQFGSATYTFAVPEPSAPLLAACGLLAFLRRRR